MGSLLPTQGLNPHPWQGSLVVLTAGLPGNSLQPFFNAPPPFFLLSSLERRTSVKTDLMAVGSFKYNLDHLFIFGCAGSSFLHADFL